MFGVLWGGGAFNEKLFLGSNDVVFIFMYNW